MNNEFFKYFRYTLRAIFILIIAQFSLNALAGDPKVQPKTAPIFRSEKILNGEWLFQPAYGKAEATPDPTAWGKIRVPGAWAVYNAWWAKVPEISMKGTGSSWNIDISKLNKSWYERSVIVPENWKGKTVELEIERVSTDAVIFINGNKAGNVEWYSGKVDITRWVQWGKENIIRILVVASPEQGKVAVLMGTAESQVTFSDASLPTRGITGNVILGCRPTGLRIEDCFVKTSFRQKAIEAEIEFSNYQPNEQIITVSKISDTKGVVVKQFTDTLILNSKQGAVAKTSSRWENPVLWDLDSPYLYTYTCLVYKSGVLVDSYDQTFGFREFWIDGKNFFMNGSRINLRPTLNPPGSGMTELIAAGISGLKKTGYNFAEFWPSNYDQRGDIRDFIEIMEVADKEGFLVSGVLLPFTAYILDNTWSFRWDQPGVKEKWENRMLLAFKKQRNHPSVVMWGTAPNFYGNPQDQNPLLLGQKGWIKDNDFWSRNAAAAQEALAVIKKHDNTRPVFTHHGTYVGDIHTVNLYLNFIPLQEREEWLSHYSDFGKMPFMGIEFGTPLHCNFLRGRNGFGNNITTEPLVTEFVAMYNGPKSYYQETTEYRELIKKNFKGGQTYVAWPDAKEMERMPGFQDLEHLFIKNTWRSWRTWGIPGGMIPWSNAHGWMPKAKDSIIQMPPFEEGRKGNYFSKVSGKDMNYFQSESWDILSGGQALIENNNDVLAYIAGSKDAFTAKDHHYKPGDLIEKQLYIFNDTRKSQICQWKYAIVTENSVIAEESGKVTLPPGEKINLPIYSRISTNQEVFKREGSIRAQVQINNKELRDTLNFRIIKRPASKMMKIHVFDPEGNTRNMLQNLGYTVEDWDGSSNIPFLVMGRNSMLSGYKPHFNLEKFVYNGGKVLVMNQHPDSVAATRGLRYSAFVSRYVFPISKNGLFDGLDETDFRNWTGHSKMVEPYPDYLNNTNYRKANGSPYHGWKWGNRGGVATGAIEKPHRSSWRPLMECEFDLAYSPLMELPFGSGHLIYNTLDLEDHYQGDVVASLFFDRLIQYIDVLKPVQKSLNVTLLGNNTDKQFLNNIGLIFTKVENLDTKTDLLLVGNINPEQEKQVLKYVQKGGKVLVLPRATGEQFLGVKYRLDSFCNGANSIPEWNESQGLSISDTRYRTSHPTWLLDNGCEIEAGGFLGLKQYGKGKILFCQFNPDQFSADSLTYFRFTRWRQTRAFTQVATNMGASCVMDKAFFHTRTTVKPVSLDGMWKAAMTLTLPAAKEVADKYSDPGISDAALKLVQTDADESSMVEVPINMVYEKSRKEWENTDGELVFRKKVIIPEYMNGKELELHLAVIDDFDDVYWNGILIGKTGKEKEPVWNYSRIYSIPSNLVKSGVNVLSIRMFDAYGGGGLVPTLKRREIVTKEKLHQESFYHKDYLDDFEMGDDPFRYFRW